MKININKDWLHQRYIMEQLSKQQIANLLGCGYGTIDRRLKKFGIKIRSQKEALKIDNNRPEKKEKFRQNMLENNPTKSFEVRQKISKFAKTRTRENHPSWKVPSERKTDFGIAIRQSLKYKQWRTSCFKRDNFICQFCKQRGGRLNVDHTKPFSVVLKENKITSIEEAYSCNELWNLDNGRTLCISCHRKTDTFGFKARTYKNAA